jgi:serine/threonine protein phosphatase PrpC
MVSDAQLLRIIGMADSTADACRIMAETALRNGGRDNITLLLAHVLNTTSAADPGETLSEKSDLDATHSTLS